MATPKEALTGVSQTININSNAKASPKNQSIGNQDTVTFKNNDPNNGATVTFQGAGANEFGASSFTVPAGGGTAGPLTPTLQNVTVDYQITMGPDTGLAFSIEVGSGPLEIDIVNVFGDTNLPTAGIPNNGTLFFKNLTGGTATITFRKPNVLFDSNGNSVTSQVVNPNSSGAVLTGRGTNQDVGYGLSVSADEDPGRVGDGSGTIKVGST